MVTSKERRDNSVSHTEYKWFVWVRCNGYLWPQAWAEDETVIEGRLSPVVAKHKLTKDDQGLSFTELAKKYPAPEQKDG